MTSALIMIIVGVLLSWGAKVFPSEFIQKWMAKLGYWQSVAMLGVCVAIATGWQALACYAGLSIIPPTELACGVEGFVQAILLGITGWASSQTTYATVVRRL